MTLDHCYQGDCRDVMRELIAAEGAGAGALPEMASWSVKESKRFGVAV